MSKFEKRGGQFGVETRAEGEKRTLVGYAIIYNSPTLIGDLSWGFMEEFAPGSVDEAIKGDVRALFSHDSGRVIGRTKSGTLRLESDERGVKVEIDVPNTTDGNDLWELVERGDISGMSFSFRSKKDEWDETVDPPKRRVTLADVYEVSAVAFPAYDDTELGKRSLDEWRDAHHPEPIVEDKTADKAEEIPAPPVSRAAPHVKARLSMDLDLKVRTKR
jgi:HK97 family phage prohead protease